MKKKFLALLTLFTLLLGTNLNVYAQEQTPMSLDNILENAQVLTTDDGTEYHAILIPEEEFDNYLEFFINPNTRNILLNLVVFSYSCTKTTMTLKVTNIAIDSLDFCYGYVSLYSEYGLVGSGNFSFTRIPPMKSDYATFYSSGGGWRAGVMGVDAADGTVSNSGVFYFDNYSFTN